MYNFWPSNLKMEVAAIVIGIVGWSSIEADIWAVYHIGTSWNG